MATSLILAALLLAQTKKESPGPMQSPALVLVRSMEIDDISGSLGHQEELLAASKTRFANTQRSYSRGLAAQDALERDRADMRYQEARLAEMNASRALKVYERDVLSGTIPLDEAKAFAAALEVLKAHEALARVDVDFNTYRFKQADSLYKRNVIARQQKEAAENGLNAALASASLSRLRQAKLALEHAASVDAKGKDLDQKKRLRESYLKEQLVYDELEVWLRKYALTTAEERSRTGQTAVGEVAGLRRSLESAQEALAADRAKMGEPPKSDPPPKPAVTPS